MPAWSVVDRFLRPSRAALDAARAAVAGHTDPRAAWDALCARGLLPASFRDDPRRRFPWLPGLTEGERSQRLRYAPYVPRAPCPDDVTACALLAADVAGVERAEALGRAMVAALGAWGAPAVDAVLWVPTSWRSYGYQTHDTKPGVWEPDNFVWRAFPGTRWEEVCPVIDRLGGEGAAATPYPDRRAYAARDVGVWVFAEERWADAVRTRRRTPHGENAPDRLYADLQDPFAPAVALFESGYAPMPSGEAVLVLGYPMD